MLAAYEITRGNVFNANLPWVKICTLYYINYSTLVTVVPLI